MIRVVAIVGSRRYVQIHRVVEFVDRLSIKYPDCVVVSGGAEGVDYWAESTARATGLDVISYRPYEYTNMKYEREFSIETLTFGERAQEIVVAKKRRISPPWFRTYGQAAFHRNGWIVDDGTEVVAFWDGSSRGTQDSMTKARKLGKEPHVFQHAA